MKKVSRLLFVISLAASASFAMDENGWATSYESISAFDNTNPLYGNRPDYVKPLITNFGAIFNSNWVSSSGVPKSFTFELGLPFAIAPITNSDREYGNAYPTIFGGNDKNNAYRLATDICSPEALQLYGGCSVINGNENLNSLGAFTFPYLQVAGSFYHARAVLRGMYLPSIKELKHSSMFGFGLQYSFGHFFQYMLPRIAQPFDVSLLYSYSTGGISYTPKEYKGTLDLDISTYTVDLVLGYRPFSFIETMITLGYQYASMKSSGHLDHESNPLMQINPNITVKGDNGLHFGFEVAFQFGTYHPVVGYDYVGKTSFTTNLIYFKQTFGKDKTPAEIAKEKAATNETNEKEDEDIKVENDSEENTEAADQEPDGEESDSEPSEESSDNSTPDESGDDSIAEEL